MNISSILHFGPMIGGVVAILAGVAQVASALTCKIGITTPGVACGDLKTGITLIGGGWVALGLGHKADSIIASQPPKP